MESKKKSDAKHFADRAERARDYRGGTLVGMLLSQLKGGQLFGRVRRARRAARPTIVITRVFRTAVLFLTFIERSAVLLAATAVTLILIPPTAVLLVSITAIAARSCRRAYARMQRLPEIERGITVMLARDGSVADASLVERASAIADGRVGAIILPGYQRGAILDRASGVFVGGDMFFFFLKRRTKRDGVPLWVIY